MLTKREASKNRGEKGAARWALNHWVLGQKGPTRWLSAAATREAIGLAIFTYIDAFLVIL